MKTDDMCRLFNKDICLCNSCQNSLEPKFIHFKVEKYKALAIYEYTDFIKNIIFLYKGCFDFEMKDVFLNLFIKEIKSFYSGRIIIPAPSYFKDDERRGFNHVIEAFKDMGLKIYPIVEKTSHFKQAENSAQKRKEIEKHLTLKSNNTLAKQRVLIVDDIYTTGATIRAMIKLVEKLNPKEIKVLVLAKTKDKNNKKSNTNISLH